MALWARRAGGDAAEAAGARPWGSFSPDRSNGCRHSPEAWARAERNLSGGQAAASRSGVSGMGGRGHLAEGCDRALRRRGRGCVDRSRAGRGAAGMLSLSPATRIFVALQPMDMRAGFNRLYAHVQARLNQDPLERPSFRVHQSAEEPRKDFVFRWLRPLGLCQALGAWQFRLAERGGVGARPASGRIASSAARVGGHATAQLVPPVIFRHSCASGCIFHWTPFFPSAIVGSCLW